MVTRRTRSRRRRLRFVAWVGLCCVGLWLAVEWALWPDVAALARVDPHETAFTRRHEGEQGTPVTLEWVPYDRISGHLKRAVLVAEDINFFSHSGFDTSELRLAVAEAIEHRRSPRGASTISQQLAKNLWLSPARSIRRKGRELLLTRALEQSLAKRRILELYLNVVDFGGGNFGCGRASRHYFGKSSSGLSAHEAARMAAVLPRPSSWSPDGREPEFLAAVARIEGRMQRAAWLREAI